MEDLPRLQAKVAALERRVGDLGGGDGGGGGGIPFDLQPIPVAAPAPPAANQIRNGDKSHSVNTYLETVAAPGTDKVLECAHWFSNDTPVAGQALSFVNAITSSANKTLKAVGHSTYSADYCDWLNSTGVSRLQGTKSLDAPFPGNCVFPGRPMYLGAIIARRNSTIVIPTSARIAAMLYDNTPGSEDIIKAGNAFTLNGAVRGVPGATTERRYKVLAQTDRGYEFLSTELVLAGAPTDASFSPGSVDVGLSWPAIEGILRYVVYRRNVVAGTYDKLAEITSGTNSYGDNNVIQQAGVGGYPAASDDRVRCYVATLEGELSNLAIDGVSLKWDSLFLNIPVPSPLLATGAGHQVLRLAMTQALDREMTDAASTAANNRITSATGAFTARDTGRTATLYDSDGNVVHGPEAITFVDATHVDFATNVATTEADARLYIEEGGDHGLLMDMVHIGYLSQAAYAPYADDINRTLPSTAAPNTSGQGGLGPPGDSGEPGDGGLGGCVEITTPVITLFGNMLLMMPFEEVLRGQPIRSGNLLPNFVLDIKLDETDNLHIVRTANGWELPCSPGQILFTSFMDRHGIPVSRLKIGDNILTCVDGRDECSPLVYKLATGKRAKVGTFSLSPSNKYIAGRAVLPWWKRVIRWVFYMPAPVGGIYCHNVKRVDGNVF